MKWNGNTLSDIDDIANGFQEYFRSVYDTHCLNSISPSEYKGNTLSEHVDINFVSKTDILAGIKKLKPKKSVGPDDIPPYIVKACQNIFLDPLHHIFNLSLKTCTYPEKWKLAKVCPIYKNGDKGDITNYRPISILSVFSKIFESVLYKYIYSQVEKILSPYQYGFRTGKSTVSNLIYFSDFVYENLNVGGQVDVIYTDFQKAFDKVNHCILLDKLTKIGFSPLLQDLLKSYLEERKQYVVFKGAKSELYNMTSGVPQGSNLGPLLFLLFINDLPYHIQYSECLLYADDIKIFRNIKDINDSILLQYDIDNLMVWSQTNHLYFNIKKCFFVKYTRKKNYFDTSYSMGGALLDKKVNAKDLGVIFDNRFTFDAQVKEVIIKASKTLGFIIRNSYMFSKSSSTALLYNSFVRSIIEYASLVWSTSKKTHIKALEMVQKRLTRVLYFREFGLYPTYKNYISYESLLNIYCMNSLEVRREITGCLFMYDLINMGKDDLLLRKINFYVPTFNSRYQQIFYLPKTNYKYCFNSPLVRMCRKLNTISNSVDLYNNRKNFIESIQHCLIKI